MAVRQLTMLALMLAAPASAQVPEDTLLEPYAVKLADVGFAQRRQLAEHTPSGAVYLTPADLRRRRVNRTSQLIAGQRGIRTIYVADVLVPYGRDGRCIMSVWLDGMEMRDLFPAHGTSGSLLRNRAPQAAETATRPGVDLINVSDIAAVEIYPSFSGTPPQFQDATSGCGAIVLWTKQ